MKQYLSSMSPKSANITVARITDDTITWSVTSCLLKINSKSTAKLIRNGQTIFEISATTKVTGNAGSTVNGIIIGSQLDNIKDDNFISK